MDEETYCEAIKEEIEQNRDEHTKTVREILNQSRITATEPKLDKAVTMIPKYLEQAATKVVPARCIVSRSKTLVDQGTHSSIQRAKELKGSPQKLDERIPLALTLPCRTNRTEMQSYTQTSPENETGILQEDDN